MKGEKIFIQMIFLIIIWIATTSFVFSLAPSSALKKEEFNISKWGHRLHRVWIKAIQDGDYSKFNKILDKVDLNAVDDLGHTGLFYVIEHQRFEMLRMLFKRGVLFDKSEFTLHEIIIRSKFSSFFFEVLKMLLDSNPDMSVRDQHGSMPLHVLSAVYDSSDLIQKFIDNGADVNVLDDATWTPLIIACCRGYLGNIECLLSNGADINYRSRDGYTALLMLTELNRFQNAKRIEFFVRNGADVNVKDAKGNTPLIFVSQKGDYRAVEEIIKRSIQIDEENFNNQTALMVAVEQGHESIVDLLIQNGADVNKENADGDTPLIVAIKKRYYLIAQRLIQNGANLDKVNDVHETALMHCAFEGGLHILRLLLQNGADANLKRCQSEVMVLNGADANLKKYWVKATALMLATWNGKEEVVRYLSYYGADMNRAENMIFPYHISQCRFHLNITQFLLKRREEVQRQSIYLLVGGIFWEKALSIFEQLIQYKKNQRLKGTTHVGCCYVGSRLSICSFFMTYLVDLNKPDYVEFYENIEDVKYEENGYIVSSPLGTYKMASDDDWLDYFREFGEDEIEGRQRSVVLSIVLSHQNSNNSEIVEDLEENFSSCHFERISSMKEFSKRSLQLFSSLQLQVFV